METTKEKVPVSTKETTDLAGNSKITLSPTSKLILKEAKKRSISVEFIVAEKGLFKLHYGKRTVFCLTSLTELTSVVSAEICLDKYITNNVLQKVGIKVPMQMIAASKKENTEFFNKYKRVVTKPISEALGRGVSVDIRTAKEMHYTIGLLKISGDEGVLIEEFVEGEDLRIIVIDKKFVAAIHRTPPQVTGNGKTQIRKLIELKNKTLLPDNQIPFNYETRRCVELEGYKMRATLPEGITIHVRKNANEHTGGVPMDVTDRISPSLRRTAEKIATIIDIPVTGIDFLVPEVDGDDYTVIEVNSRPGLDGHEPQPVTAAFIDLLFPETKKN